MENKILEVLEKQNKGLTLIEINDLLGFTSIEEYKELHRNIFELVSLGKIHKSKKDKFILMELCSSLLTGYIHINKSGNGFVDTKYDEDTFVARENLNGAVDGDFVEIDVQGSEGIVVNILKRDLSTVVGEIVKKRGKLEFALDDKKKKIRVEITRDSIKRCVEGHKVLVKIIKELKTNLYLGEVVKILGHKNDPGVDILTIACSHDIELDFSDAVMNQVNNIPMEVLPSEYTNRRDLRDRVIFTIDGDDTKDIDDAISIEKDGDNYILGVHIADVSHYVKEGTPLFDAALEKGTSSYLADTVLPMLPHELSNGICSLNEGVDRLALSCEMVINPHGQVIDYDIFSSVINSKKKMTYKNVNQIIMQGAIPSGYERFIDKLYLMQELAHILRAAKNSKGYIDFGLDEAKIIQDESGKAIDVVRRVQLEGEKLIEDFMIVANETVATHISNMDLPFVYRIHGEPRAEKIEDFLNLVKMMGYNLNVDTNSITPKTMQNILAELKDKPGFEILSDMLLRSMKKAIYSTNNIGHFGLASKIYTHFTSPIRRFPDLMVHTLLHKYLFEYKADIDTVRYYEQTLPNMCEIASEREVAAIEAEREVLDMKMAEYMESHIGEEYDGIVSGVTNFGLFVELPNLVEGLVHISTLNGFYTHVPELLSLVSENNIKYTIGDMVRIKVVGASKAAKTIDFEIVGNKDGNKE
ncbi:MAG: ribonuclease R [Firmicutes bacterium]|nr:ribonuclease R [Bacillota bacterium]